MQRDKGYRYLSFLLSLSLFFALKTNNFVIIRPPSISIRITITFQIYGNTKKVSRKAIKKLLAGGNIPTRVVTLIYLAGLCITASQHLSLPPPSSLSPTHAAVKSVRPLRGIAVCGAGQTEQRSAECAHLSASSNVKAVLE